MPLSSCDGYRLPRPASQVVCGMFVRLREEVGQSLEPQPAANGAPVSQFAPGFNCPMGKPAFPLRRSHPVTAFASLRPDDIYPATLQ